MVVAVARYNPLRAEAAEEMAPRLSSGTWQDEISCLMETCRNATSENSETNPCGAKLLAGEVAVVAVSGAGLESQPGGSRKLPDPCGRR